MTRGPRRSLVALLAALGVLAALLAVTSPASAYPGAPWFEPSKPYDDNFPDPDVLVVGDRYYAVGTSTGGAYLPVMTSSDLRTWVAREKYDPGAPLNEDPFFNDALPYPARWGGDFFGGRMS
jgi:beta-xylosidase